jgi:hypothetical protein
MSSPFIAVFDAPQTLPAEPPPFHQTTAWYEHQQTSWPTDIVFGRGRLGRSLSSQGYPYEQMRPNRDFALQVRVLQQHYTMLNRNDLIIEILGEEPALYPLLLAAVRPLQNAFGQGRIIQVRAQVSDDDSLVKVAVQLPATFGDPEHALLSFDASWWLDNCHRSGGALVFDYEIQDAV